MSAKNKNMAIVFQMPLSPSEAAPFLVLKYFLYLKTPLPPLTYILPLLSTPVLKPFAPVEIPIPEFDRLSFKGPKFILFLR